jgi:hypothetical protein
VLLSGLALFAVGVTWLARLPLHGSYLSDLLAPSLVIGLGLGLGFAALTVAAAGGVEHTHAGVAGALINMTQQVGGAIGLAVITAVATSGLPATGATPSAVNDGFLVAAGIAAIGLALAVATMPSRRRRTRAAVALASAS